MGPGGSESDGQTPGRRADDAAGSGAERAFLAARAAWHAERGDTPPVGEAPPDTAREAERRFIAAREAWHQDRERKGRQERGERRDD